MITDYKITEIFCAVDEFCKEFDKQIDKKSLMSSNGKVRRYRKASLSDSEIMTILIMFQFGSFRNFKHYYLFFIREHLKSDFPNAVSYNRFVELQSRVFFQMMFFLNLSAFGRCTGISFVDSTMVPVCHNLRRYANKVFKGGAATIHSYQPAKAMAEIGVPPYETAVISGIGCSSRLPYHVNTYAMQTTSCAAAVATGAKVVNPKLTIWQISGDGDGLAIGGNHFIHAMRRNIDLNMILLNNRIYGLTKGQYSPTSPRGFVSKSSPYGTVEDPFRPAELCFGARGHFFARAVASDAPHTVEILKAAYHHKGAAVCEILQNCMIFNNGAYDPIYTREGRSKTRSMSRTASLPSSDPTMNTDSYISQPAQGCICQGWHFVRFLQRRRRRQQTHRPET